MTTKIYLVGGAVRDELLGLQVKDRDYVVVGSNVEEMLKKGFHKVGSDFPVFLHPETKEEYALARREKKTAPGYKGFQFEWEGVTLEEDLKRRDLTINAMAKDLESGEIIDLFGGKEDLKLKQLRHVSEHFIEDPLRVLRLARFAATFPEFNIATQTKILCEKIVQSGELNHLSSERIWLETKKALSTNHPEIYFEFLHDIDALMMFGKVSTLNLDKLKNVVHLTTKVELRLASLFVVDHIHDSNEAKVKELGQELKLSNYAQNLIHFVAKYSSLFLQTKSLSSQEIYQVIKDAKALNSDEFLKEFLLVVDHHSFMTRYFLRLIQHLKSIDLELELKEVQDQDKSQAVHNLMIQAIEEYNLKYDFNKEES